MRTAWYIGNHKGDLLGMLGYWLIRLGQWRQRFGRTTHCEAILAGAWYKAVICGASRRDGKRVRAKVTDLNPKHWVILDVPLWDQASWEKEAEPLIGVPYSDIGAISSSSPFLSLVLGLFTEPIKELGQWCSRFLLQPAKVEGAEDMNVSEAMAVVLALPGTQDITKAFFAEPVPVDLVNIKVDHRFLHLAANKETSNA